MMLPGPVSFAVLAPSKLSDLAKSSDVILRGRVLRAQLEPAGGGTAVVEVKHIYNGWVGAATLTIAWTSASHDQPLDRVGEERLFFLKRENAQRYQATQYGRSYWPLREEFETHEMVIPYIGPIGVVEIDLPGLLGTARIYVPELPRDRNPVEVQALRLDQVAATFPKVSKDDQK